MKVIKRNGSEVVFDVTKIVNAIAAANEEVVPENRLSQADILSAANKVTSRCEGLGHAPAVEEIQDMVEDEIMALGCYEVARKYIIYRYVQNQLRASNTTDDKILSLIECNNEEVKQENSNKNPTVVSVQRDYMAGEVSKDLAERMLLPEDVVEAHEEGIIHFHDADYYAQRMHNCDLVNLEDMLQNGTVISGTLIEKPHSFSTACNIATQIIAQVASCQYGGQSISLAHLAPFVDVSRQKIRRQVIAEMNSFGLEPSKEKMDKIVEERVRDEIRRGVQTIQYQVVTLMTTNGQAPFITVFMYLNEAKTEQEKRDLAICIEEMLRQRYQGVKNEKGVWITPAFPKLIYVLESDNIHEGDPYFYPHQAGGQVHGQAHGARLHLRKEDARVQALQGRGRRRRRRLHLHGLPVLPHPRPFGQRLRQRGPRKNWSPTSQVLRPFQPGRRHDQPGRHGPFERRRRRSLLEIFDERLELCHKAPHVPSQPSEGHPVRRSPDPLAVRRPGAPGKGRDDRQAAVRRLLHDQPGLRRPLRVREVHDGESHTDPDATPSRFRSCST